MGRTTGGGTGNTVAPLRFDSSIPACAADVRESLTGFSVLRADSDISNLSQQETPWGTHRWPLIGKPDRQIAAYG